MKPGQRRFILNVPWAQRSVAAAAGAAWFADTGWVYTGTALPASLAQWQPRPYTWDQWLQDDLNGVPAGNPAPDLSTGTFTLRDDQEADVELLLNARRLGGPEFLNGSDVGVGKTVSCIAAVKRLPGVRNVLVLCPLAVVPGWQMHLDKMGDGGKRWCVINYESAKRLLTPPKSAETAKKIRTKNLQTARKGTPKVEWDVVITDESHWLANADAQRSAMIERVIAGPSDRPAFSIRMSATAGSDPAQLSYLHRGLAYATGNTPTQHITSEDYQQWCEEHGIAVTAGKFGSGLAWEHNQGDLVKMNHLIFGGRRKWATRRRPNWSVLEPPRFPVPIDLSPVEAAAYEEEWSAFQVAMKEVERVRRSGRPTTAADARRQATARTKGWAAQMRYRQKAGQVRAAGTAAFAAEMVAKGRQVCVSAEFLGTVDRLAESLTAVGIAPVLFTGQNRDTREAERLSFQRGQAKVIIFTPCEGFSLHANETSVGGNSAPRVTIIAEPRWSPKKALQVEGRGHRNGEVAPVYYPWARGTIEEKVIQTVINGMRDTKTINGDDTTVFAGLTAALGVAPLASEQEAA